MKMDEVVNGIPHFCSDKFPQLQKVIEGTAPNNILVVREDTINDPS